MEKQIEKGVLTIGRLAINPINPPHKDFTIAFIMYSRTFAPPLHAKCSYFPIFGLIAYNLRFCHTSFLISLGKQTKSHLGNMCMQLQFRLGHEAPLVAHLNHPHSNEGESDA